MKFSALLCLAMLCCSAQSADQLAHVIASVKPSIVGIGSFQKARSPAIVFIGTGFVIGDGLTVVTAAHVVQAIMQSEAAETLGILIGQGNAAQFRRAKVVTFDKEHDLAQLSISGAALPPLQLGDSNKVTEGQAMAFTGFPLGMVLGLHHVTHRAIVSSITPVILPSLNAQKLDTKLIGQLQKPVYGVFQLDATAYPGSSGSPLYDPETGQVYGIVNMVYVKGFREAALAAPSGIAYAIPGNYIGELLRQK